MAKKASASSRKVTTTRNATSVDQYIAVTREPARSMLQLMRETIRSVVPPGTEEVISYKIPAFRHGRVLVWYAGFANHCSLFPTGAIIEQFQDELKLFTTSKGTVQFPLGKPLPIRLIKKLVKARVAQIAGKKSN